MSKKTEFNFSKKFKLEYVPFDAEINTAHRISVLSQALSYDVIENERMLSSFTDHHIILTSI